MFKPRVIVSLVVALNFAHGNASAGSREVHFGDNVLAPIAHTVFCTNYPLDCSKSNGALFYFTVDPEVLYRQLRAVNREVNIAIQPAPEKADGLRQWTLFPEQGNCTDYAVSKRHELLKRGWPSSALRLAEIIIMQTGEHHLVLVANIRGNSFILDNLKHEPVALTDPSEYQWVRIESSEEPGYWISMAQQ
jgi:predicted transglutaminase-like cysteine proteinase